jgi:transposase-like protein
LGIIQRGGEVVVRMLPDVRKATIEPLIKASVAPGSMICTDEYGICNDLENWG